MAAKSGWDGSGRDKADKDDKADNTDEVDLRGANLIRQVRPLLAGLHEIGAERDKASNRKLFFDDYASLLLLYFFTPALTSLRALQQATNWEQTRRKIGIRRTSLGSLSEAASVFDAEALREIVQELAARAVPLKTGHEAEALRNLTAVDGSVFRALPKMVWALWRDDSHAAAKLHLHFDVLKGVPVDAELTAAGESETRSLKRRLQPDRLYVIGRGYAKYELFADIVAAGSSFIGRVKDSVAYKLQEERELSEDDRNAGVIRDCVISRLGTTHRPDYLQSPVRLIVVETTDRDGKPHELWLLTDRLNLAAELVALAYRYRWMVELFFRWMKCILGSRHLISHSRNGITIQMYAALIVSLLITLRTGCKPTKRTFEIIQFYLLGWVSDDEFTEHLKSLSQKKSKTK
jgi:hypothetical protein